MNTGFKTSIKKKVFAIFLISLVALISSYFINQFAFSEIQSSVDDLSHTTKKLITINNVLLEVNQSEKSFRNLLTTDRSIDEFVRQSQQLKRSSDSLRSLCAANKYQVSLINAVDSLLGIRQKFLLNYIDFRRKLNNSNPLMDRARILDSLFSIESAPIDSLVYSNVRNQSVTQIDTVLLAEQEEKKGLWKKIFGSKRKSVPKTNKVIRMDENNKVDTIIQVRRNSVTQETQRILNEIYKEQIQRRETFKNRENRLNGFESSFHNQITNLLSEIERDITRQTGLIHDKAENSIGVSKNRTFAILSLFLLVLLIIVFLMLGDITRSNKYRQLLEEARKDAEWQSLSWQRFLSNMSHEIRTPLQSIIGYSEQMKKQDRADPGYVTIIHDSSEHLLQIINEILDYNRISSGKFVFERVRFNMRQLLSEVLAILRLPTEQKGIDLISNEHALPEDGFLEGDPFRLRQILLNLIGNAIKFTAEGKIALQVTTTSSDTLTETFTFKVSDTGPGIPVDMQEVIFNRFEKVALSSEQQYQGSGLGLSIVKALIEGQGGHISLLSEPGKGACFTFSITYTKAGASVARKTPVPAPLRSANGPVWLVDDDRLILQLCGRILEKHHIPYECFHTVASFLDSAADQHPSLFLVDIRMPHKNGFQLYDEIRNSFPAGIPVIAVTAQALAEERYEILRHGFNDILLKPFREEELLSLIHKWTGHSFPATLAPINDINANGGRPVKQVDPDIEILQCYREETAQDIAHLQSAVDGENGEAVAMMLHRLAGRTAQIGEKELGQNIRKMELLVRNTQTVDHDGIDKLIKALRAFLSTIPSS
ncbi:ATP-binding protein [Taibaiella koreensis]|uniref:ATP-binding protein n=1 Tax=Taibaiella koreensis TaxID=1268548 RepID=UPI000E59CC91|nr:ATP-binding protein [Taibaiella koreensis]